MTATIERAAGILVVDYFTQVPASCACRWVSFSGVPGWQLETPHPSCPVTTHRKEES